MTNTLTDTLPAVRQRREARHNLIRARAARTLRSLADLLASYHPGDPSPCCEGEKLYRSPWLPGTLVCSNDGQQYPARDGGR